MVTRADLTLFAHLVARPDEELDLARATLLVAEPEYPGLDVSEHVGRLDLMGAEARRGRGQPPIAPIVRYLYEELGFRGNAADYYDPRNSFLNEVLDRRLGIPVTLAIVLMEMCRRAGIEAHGIAFPGHFLVQVADLGGPLIIDPFDGRLLDRRQLEQLQERVTGVPGPVDPGHLVRASKATILLRVLTNLRAVYEARGDVERLQAVRARIALVAPRARTARTEDRTPPTRPRTLN